MKTSTATINIVLLAKPDRTGLHPVVLRAHWQGKMAEKRTGISIPTAVWNKRTCNIQPSYPNSSTLNNQIHTLYNEAMERKLLLEKEGSIKDIKEVFQSGVIRNKLDYKVLMEEMIKARALSYSTSLKLRYSYSTLCRFMDKDVFRITDMTCDRLAAYGRWLQSTGLKNGSIKDHLYDVSNVWTYAISQRLVDPTTNPFITFHPKMIYPVMIEKKAITKENLYQMEHTLIDLIVSHNKDLSVFSDIHTDEFALAMYILGYRFGGLALVDMANLRKDKLEVVRKGVLNYYVFRDVQRQKTNRPVPLIVKQDIITRPLVEYYLSTPGDYLFPINDHIGSPKEQHKRMNTVARTINNHLRKATGLDITYYSCRHTFCTIAMNEPGINLPTVATLMGRSPAGIFRYVKEISSTEDIINARSLMGL